MNQKKILKFIIVFILFIQIDVTSANQKFFLSAETIKKDDNNNSISAYGKVNITSDKIKLKADEITYYLDNNKLFAKGNVIIFEESGNIVYASEAKLSKNFKNSFIKNIGVLLANESRLAASSAQSFEDDNKTTYNNVVFTKCNNCKDKKDKNVMWSLKAKKATHLKKNRIILYENVFLEAFNIPILYTPIFYHPDPTVKSKTGLLTPKISNSNTFGTSYEQPIFFNLSNSSNLTVTTKYSSKEGFFINNEHKKISNDSNLKLKYSATKGTKVRVNEPAKKEFRGHLDLKYIHKPSKNWFYGANIKRSSDKSYLSKYNLSEGESILNQSLFSEWGSINKKITLDLFKFQSLSDEYQVFNLPFIRPIITLQINNLNNKKRDKNHLYKVSLNSITRKNNKNVDSIHLASNHSKNYIFNGLLLKEFILFNIDAYKSNGTTDKKNLIKLFPQLGLEAQYPFIKYNKNSTYLIEPKIQLFLAPDDFYNNRIRNEDSLDLDLTSSNLFNYDRYPGNDRVESGTRGNYGIMLKKIGSHLYNISSSLGQTFNINDQELFKKNSGFKNNRSEIVGNFIYNLYNFDFSYDYRFSENLKLKRNTLNAKTDTKKLDLNLSYIQLKDFASANNSDTEQINYGFKYDFNNFWSIKFNQLRDLAGAVYSFPLRSSLGLEFSNECTVFQLLYTRDRSYSVDIPAVTNLSFNIKLFGF